MKTSIKITIAGLCLLGSALTRVAPQDIEIIS